MLACINPRVYSLQKMVKICTMFFLRSPVLRSAAYARGFSSVAPCTVIDVNKLSITQSNSPKPRIAKEKLVFGATTTDHMLEVDWDAKTGYHAPVISPYHNLSLDPACSVFHYAIEAFEGMKAYRDDKGGVRLFRPEMNMKRFNYSMDQLSLPKLDEAGYLECIKKLVLLDRDWIPEGNGYSLYLRPTVIGTQPTLGVSKSHFAKLYTICCPVGPYYPEGFKPVSLLAESHAVRAWPGGVGNAKLGGNYAPSIRVQAEAAKKGFSQVLWLFGDKHEVTEVGTMNFFLFWIRPDGKKELITPPLDGTILPGVTRQSVLDLTRQWGDFEVTEAKFTMQDLVEASKENRILEAFGSGTAAVVSPIRNINYEGVDYNIPVVQDLGAGQLTKRIADTLADIQYGRVESPWSVLIS